MECVLEWVNEMGAEMQFRGVLEWNFGVQGERLEKIFRAIYSACFSPDF